jgi:hypothetical protein
MRGVLGGCCCEGEAARQQGICAGAFRIADWMSAPNIFCLAIDVTRNRSFMLTHELLIGG